LYSLGLRLGEGLRLQVGDIDGVRRRVHVRDAKGNRDRFVPLPGATHQLLRRFWRVHRNPVLLFPDRHRGLQAARSTTTALNAEGVQRALARVIGHCGLKKRRSSCPRVGDFRLTSYRIKHAGEYL
ncbi:MAG: tyrosine-type recombinase/integrase, partial [Burkholderiales bacterium]